MKTRLTLVLALGAFVFGAASPAHSQEEAPAPAHPAVKLPPGDFSLVKKFDYAALPTGPAAAGMTLEVDSVKSGTLRKDIVHYANGKAQEMWRVQNYRLTMFPNDPQSMIVDRVTTNDDIYSSYRYHDATDFPELDWAPNAGFSEVKLLGDKKCFVYKLNDQVLWIDATAGVPLYFESKGLRVTYTWSAGGEPLQLPPGAAQKIDKFKRRL